MSRIRILPPELANRIAAGEVVERPASIVKELIENAIDADAREIRIDIEAGGVRQIRVTDDGVGMDAVEAPLALARHATSKIRSAEDLHAIRTLGFRGEALPSIAAVSHFTLTSKPRGSGVTAGTRVHVAGGVDQIVAEAGCPEGTEIVIRDLFGNVPARRKFLKSERTEFSHIEEVVCRFALAYPTLRLRLTHDGRMVTAAHGNTGLAARVAELFGADVMTEMAPIDEGSEILRLEGLCGRPTLARANGHRNYCFVNGRPVRDRVLLHAIAEGYRTYLPKGENPFVVLFLTIDPQQVDVNVHPAKAEVRFVNPGGVHAFVSHAVRKVLAVVPSPFWGEGRVRGSSQLMQSPPLPNPPPKGGGSLNVQESMVLYQPPPVSQPDLRTHALTHLSSLSPPPFRPLGQLAETYLLYEGPAGELLLVDQHAAHERIGYERLKAGLAAGPISQQLLFTPIMVELEAVQAAAVADAAALLHEAGCDIEPFGGTTVAVKAIPALLADADIPALVRAMADDLLAVGNTSAVAARIDHLLATMACHRQVRGGDRLGPEELAALVGQMAEGVSKERCPHGRPTWVAFRANEIAKWFKRT